MPQYTNIMHGIDLVDGEKRHYYARHSFSEGEFEISLKDLDEFLRRPTMGKPLDDFAQDIISVYNLLGRFSDLEIFNVTRNILEEYKTWPRVVGNFDPMLVLRGSRVVRARAKPMTFSSEQVLMLERELQKGLG